MAKPGHTSKTYALVAWTLIAAFLAGPLVVAHAPEATVGTAIAGAAPSIWDGPLTTTLPADRVQQFVDLWAPRLLDVQTFTDFMDTEGIPADIAAEGFHGPDLTGEDKAYLIAALVDSLDEKSEAFKAKVAETPTGELAERYLQLKNMVYIGIFGKDALRDAFATPDDEKPLPEEGPTAEAISFEKQFEDLRDEAPLPVADLRSEDMPPELALPPVNEENLAARWTEPRFEEPLLPETVLALPLNPADAQAFLKAAMYNACGQIGTGPIRCGPAPVPFGTPVALDLDGNTQTGVGGMDVVADVLPIPLNLPPVGAPQGGPTQIASQLTSQLTGIASDLQTPGIGATVKVVVLPSGTNQNPSLAARVWAVYGIADPDTTTGKLITLGVDGTTSKLPKDSTVVFKIRSLPELLNGRIIGTANFTFENPGSSVALTTSVSDSNAQGQAVNPTSVALRMSPVPKVGIDIDLRTDGSRFIGTMRNSVSTVATVTFEAVRSTGTTRAEMVITNLPTTLTVDITKTTGGLIINYAASSTIGRIDMSFLKTGSPGTQSATATLLSLPSQVNINLDFSAQTVAWSANGPVSSITATSRFIANGRTWDATMTILGVPNVWNLSFAGGHPRFQGVSGPLGSVAATVTNHGTVTTFPGNHLSVFHRQANGDLDASFRMSSINLADVLKTSTGFTADLRMGGGQAFFVHGDVILGSTKVLADVNINPLPTSIQVTQNGDLITYNANANFDLSAYAEVGHIAGAPAAPDPPSIRGLAVRDGTGCVGADCGTGLKARLFLAGFPTGFTADASARTVSVTNFRPLPDVLRCGPLFCFLLDRDSLTLDVELDNIVSPAVDVRAVQDGIPSPMSFNFGPITQDIAPGGGKRISVSYTASGAMGPFTADVKIGTNVGRLEISNIPSSVSATIVTGNPTSTVSISTAQSINRIFAGAKVSASDATFSGGVELLQIPTSVSLSFGRVEVNTGGDQVDAPGLSYSASASTLDINVFVEAALFGGDLKARLRLDVDNLGASTTMSLSGTTLNVASSPSTTNLEVHIWAEYFFMKTFNGCAPSSCPGNRIQWGDHAGVVPLTVNDLKFRLTNFNSFIMKLGIASSVQGTYGVFDFGWSSIRANIDIHAFLKACVDVFIGSGCSTLVSFNWHENIPVNVLFHLATQHTGNWFTVCILSLVEIDVNIRPHPHGASWNGFVLSNPGSSEGSAWVITPDPFDLIPDRFVQLVASLKDPLGGNIDVSVGAFC